MSYQIKKYTIHFKAKDIIQDVQQFSVDLQVVTFGREKKTENMRFVTAILILLVLMELTEEI